MGSLCETETPQQPKEEKSGFSHATEAGRARMTRYSQHPRLCPEICPTGVTDVTCL